MTQAEHDSDWYRAAVRTKQAQASAMAAGASKPSPEASTWQQDLARQHEEIRQAGERNARAMGYQMALIRAQEIHLRETSGLVLPHPTDMKAGAAQTDYVIATDHLLAGRFADGQADLDRAKQRAARDRNCGALARLEKLSAEVAKAQPQAAPPALVRTAQVDASTVTAVDQHGTEHTITWRDGQVTVTSPAGTLAGPDGGDPTAAARAMAGQLAAQTQAEHDAEPQA